MGSKCRLFSEDGIVASHAQTVPSCMYLPDESTLNEIKYLFTTLKSTQKGDDYPGGPLNILNVPYSADLALLTSDGNGAVLSLEDVINGMCKIATHFVSNHQLIQARANAYLRCKLAGAEMLINGVIRSQNEQSVERDQILLTSATVPSSPRDYENGHNELTRENSMGRLSLASSRRDLGTASDRIRDCATPPPSTLFRSPSVGHEHLNSFAPNLFTMDDNTLSAALNFLPELFQNNGFASSKDLSPYDANKLAELWEFFDLDGDRIVTRDDILLGLSNIAKYYLATDDFTQLLANSYVQRKIRKAVYAVDKCQRSSALQSTAQYSNINDKNKNKSVPSLPIRYEPGATVIYTDEEGNHHVTKIIRLSQRQVSGGDAYYIETKGVKLYVSASRLRTMDAQDSAMLERLDQNQNSIRQKPQQPKDIQRNTATSSSLDSNSNSQSSSSSSRKDARAAESKTSPRNAVGSSSSGSTVTPAKARRPGSHHNETGTAGDDTPTSASKGGILGYLKSSIGILGIGGGKATVSPATVIPETPSKNGYLIKRKGSADNGREVQVYGDGRDADSVVEGEDGSSYVEAEAEAVEGVPVVPESEGNSALQSFNSRTNNSQQHSRPDSRDSVELLGPGETAPMAVSADLVSVSAPGNTPRGAVPAVAVAAGSATGPADPSALSASTSQRLKQSAAMLALDGEVLQAVRKVTGPSYKLTRSMFPKPKKTEPYPIYFNRGKNGFFEFNQVDFGVQFTPFLKDMVIPAQDPRWQSHSDTLTETNRCFFLHFGVAMGLHPISLQQCFRSAAAELLRFPENEMTIFFGEALESLLLRNDFVDAQVLSAIWPLEFDKYKVLIVRVDHNGRIESFTSFRSEAGPVDDNGEWNGEELIFTLQWNHFTILKPKSDQLNKPITAVLAAASMIGIMPLEFITKVDPDPAKRFKIC